MVILGEWQLLILLQVLELGESILEKFNGSKQIQKGIE